MSLFDLPIDEAVEPEVVPEGEYELQIYSAEPRTAKQSGRPMLTVVLHNLSSPNGQHIYFNLNGVMPDDEPQTRNIMLLNGKRFCDCFRITPPINPIDIVGRTGRALLIVEEDNNGIPRNRVRKFL